MASLFIGILVEKYVACQSRKSDFGWHRFSFSPCLMPKRVEKSEAILGLLDSFQELYLVVSLSNYCIWCLIFISNLMKPSVVYVAVYFIQVCKFETMILPSIRFDINWQNFKKPLDTFSRQIERKRSKEYLVINLPVKESLERFSCLEFTFEKSKHREAGLKHKLKL